MSAFQQRILGIFAVVIISLLAFVFLIVLPILIEIKNSSQELWLAKQELAVMLAKSHNLLAWEKEYPLIKPKAEKIEASLVNRDVPIEFMNFLEKLAKESRTDVEISLLPETAQKGDGFGDLSFNISAIGSFPNCLRFFEKLENAPYLVEAQSFSFQIIDNRKIMLKKYEGASIGNVELNLLVQVGTTN